MEREIRVPRNAIESKIALLVMLSGKELAKEALREFLSTQSPSTRLEIFETEVLELIESIPEFEDE